MSDEASELSDDEDAEQFAGDRDGVLPPLEPNQILRLVERTAALGLHFPKKIDHFNPEEARLTYNGHLESWGLNKREPPHARGQEQPRVFVSRPPLENCSWSVDLSDAKLRALLAMPHAERAKKLHIYASGEATVNRQLAGRGFLAQSLVYMEDDAALPAAVDPTAMNESESEGEHDISAPERLTLPPCMPSLPSGKPAAATIVKEYEEYVKVGDDVYSPMRLWTLQARKVHEKLRLQTSLFGRRAQLYLYVVSRGVEPEEMTEKESDLRKLKKAWMEHMPKEEAKQVDFSRAARVATERRQAATAAAQAAAAQLADM